MGLERSGKRRHHERWCSCQRPWAPRRGPSSASGSLRGKGGVGTDGWACVPTLPLQQGAVGLPNLTQDSTASGTPSTVSQGASESQRGPRLTPVQTSHGPHNLTCEAQQECGQTAASQSHARRTLMATRPHHPPPPQGPGDAPHARAARRTRTSPPDRRSSWSLRSSSSTRWPKGSEEMDTMLERMTLLSLLPVGTSWSSRVVVADVPHPGGGERALGPPALLDGGSLIPLRPAPGGGQQGQARAA